MARHKYFGSDSFYLLVDCFIFVYFWHFSAWERRISERGRTTRKEPTWVKILRNSCVNQWRNFGEKRELIANYVSQCFAVRKVVNFCICRDIQHYCYLCCSVTLKNTGRRFEETKNCVLH